MKFGYGDCGIIYFFKHRDYSVRARDVVVWIPVSLIRKVNESFPHSS